MAIVRTVSSYDDLKKILLSYIVKHNKMDDLQLSDSWLFFYMIEFLYYGKAISKNGSHLIEKLTKTIVIEDDFDSTPYSKDYFHYYASITNPPKKLTRRIHFFSKEFNETIFWHEIISGSNDYSLEDHYLGYLIVKPIINTFVGCTFFYPKYLLENSHNAHLPAIGTYQIKFFGKSIKLNGLPFQEQDGDISVCATNALWSAFYKLHQVFGVSIPSPTEIQFAAGPFKDGSRTIPSSQGLTIGQVANAISHFGLTSELREWNLFEIPNHQGKPYKNKDLKRFIYAYLKMGIPVILGFKQFESEEESKEYFSDQEEAYSLQYSNHNDKDNNGLTKETNLNFKNEQLHLVTVIGYETFNSPSSNRKNNLEVDDYLANTDQISALICHNDTLGPYSRLIFSVSNDYLLEIEYPSMGPVEAATQNVLVPIVDEIKITFENISLITRHLDIVVKNSSLDSPEHCFKLSNPSDLIWEIFVHKTADYKEEIALMKGLDKNQKIQILQHPMPKYIWVSRLANKQKGKVLLEIIFNATESPSTFFGYFSFFFDRNFRDYFLDRLETMVEDVIPNMMKEVDKPAGKLKEIQNPLRGTYFNFFKKESRLIPVTPPTTK